MSKLLSCPNCNQPVAGPSEGCVLHDLIQVARERGNLSERRLRTIHASCHVDYFWEHVGNIVDDLERGRYS